MGHSVLSSKMEDQTFVTFINQYLQYSNLKMLQLKGTIVVYIYQ